MLRKLRRYKNLGIALTMLGTIGAAPAQAATVNTVQEQKATDRTNLKPVKGKKIDIKTVGGLDLVTERFIGNPGLTPKEYGQRFGNGNSRLKKTNRHRYFA